MTKYVFALILIKAGYVVFQKRPLIVIVVLYFAISRPHMELAAPIRLAYLHWRTQIIKIALANRFDFIKISGQPCRLAIQRSHLNLRLMPEHRQIVEIARLNGTLRRINICYNRRLCA